MSFPNPWSNGPKVNLDRAIAPKLNGGALHAAFLTDPAAAYQEHLKASAKTGTAEAAVIRMAQAIQGNVSEGEIMELVVRLDGIAELGDEDPQRQQALRVLADQLRPALP